MLGRYIDRVFLGCGWYQQLMIFPMTMMTTWKHHPLTWVVCTSQIGWCAHINWGPASLPSRGSCWVCPLHQDFQSVSSAGWSFSPKTIRFSDVFWSVHVTKSCPSFIPASPGYKLLSGFRSNLQLQNSVSPISPSRNSAAPPPPPLPCWWSFCR